MATGPSRWVIPRAPDVATVGGIVGASALAAGAVSVVPWGGPVALLIAAWLILVGVAAARPLIVVGIAVVAIPLEGYAPHTLIGPSQALVGAAALGWLIRCGMSKEVELPREPGLVAFGVLVLVCLSGLVLAPEPSMVARQAVSWGTMFIVAACVVQRSGAGVRGLLLSFALSGGLAGLIALIDPQPLTGAFTDGSPVARATAGLGSPNTLGMVLCAAIPIQLVFALEGSVRWRIVSAGCALLSLIGMTMSLSRGAFLGLGAALLVLLVWTPFRRTGLSLAPLLAVFILMNPVPSVIDADRIVKRLGDAAPRAAQDDPRVLVYKKTLKMIADHPVLGVGAFEYGYFAPEYGLGSDARGMNPRERTRANSNVRVTTPSLNNAHNTFLTIAAELGLVGLGAFLALLAYAIAGLRRALRSRVQATLPMAAAVLASLTAFLVSGLAMHALAGAPLAVAFFTLAGCALALGRSSIPKHRP